MFRTTFTILFVCLFSPVAPAQDITPWTGWPVIEVPAEAAADAVVTATPVWSLDCGLEADEVVGKIVSAAPGPNGSTYLVDRQMVQLLVLDATGMVTGTIGQKGEGPGDYPGAWRAFHLDDGRVGVSAGGPEYIISYGGSGKIVLLDDAGEPAGVWYGAGDPGTMPMSSVRDLRGGGQRVLAVTQRVEFVEGVLNSIQEVCLVSAPDGEREVLARLIHGSSVNDMTFLEEDYFEPFGFGRCDLSVTGRVAFAPERDPWKVVVREPDGSGFVMARPWKPVPRTGEEKASVEELLGGHEACQALDDHPAVGRIRWRPDGRLWVEPFGVEPAEGAFACFDEFGPEGEYLRRVQLVAPGDPATDELILMENGRLALLKGFKRVAEEEDGVAVATEVVLLDVAGEEAPMQYDGLNKLYD